MTRTGKIAFTIAGAIGVVIGIVFGWFANDGGMSFGKVVFFSICVAIGACLGVARVIASAISS